MPANEKKRDPRHEKLADLYIKEMGKEGKPMSKTEMMRHVGYSATTAHNQQNRAFTSKSFQEALAERGCTKEKLSRVFDEAMDARVATVYRGEVFISDVPDHKIRLQSASLLGDFLGMKKTTVQQVNLNVDVLDDDVRGLVGL